jgi:putative ABC transport system substrate-binding protein
MKARRREFITLLGGAAAAWPMAAGAQQDGRVRRIGVLEGGVEDGELERARLAAFLQGLGRLGWSEGRNVRIDWRYASGIAERHQPLAIELLALQPELVLATTTPAAAALQRETRTIPIVFRGVSDPIGSGFVASLARPAGNLTGLLNIEATIAGKWIAMLKEIAPRLARAAFMANAKTTPYDYFLRAGEAAASSLGVELVPSRVENATEIERSIESLARQPNGGVVVVPDTTINLHRDLLMALAIRHRLPTVYSDRGDVARGGLMSYGPDRADSYRQAATYVDRILKGEKPADLPVQAPVKYETVLNMKTAKALGLTVPDLMIVRADEVIE